MRTAHEMYENPTKTNGIHTHEALAFVVIVLHAHSKLKDSSINLHSNSMVWVSSQFSA